MLIPDAPSFLRYFGSIRRRTRAVAACVPEAELEWKPPGRSWSPGDLIRHLAGAERWMFVENALGRESRYPGHGPELARGKTEVLAYLDRLHEGSLRELATLSAKDLAGPCRSVAGAEMPVWKLLRAMIEHEIHHRGQLYGLLGQLEVEVPPLFGLTEREVYAAGRPLPPGEA